MSSFYLLKTHPITAQLPLVMWRQYVALGWVELVKVPIAAWQFVLRLCLLSSLAFSLAHLFWLLLPTPNVPSAVAPSSVVSSISASQKNSTINIDQLKSFSIFGKAEAEKHMAIPVAQVMETRLNLALVGLVSSNDEGMSRAVIAAGNNQDIYAVGMSLPGGEDIILAEVMADRVIINNKGQFESLYLYQDDPRVKLVSPAAPAPVSAEAAQRMREWQEDHAEPEVVASPPKPTIYSDDQAITEVGRSMSGVAAMSVYHEAGKMLGYKISPGRDPEKFKQLGLQTGDIVIAINGWPLSNPEQMVEIYNNLSGSASLQVKRGSNIMSVDIPLL